MTPTVYILESDCLEDRRVHHTLRSAGFHIVEMEDGEALLQRLASRSRSSRCLITGLSTPKKGLAALLKELTSRDAYIPVVVAASVAESTTGIEANSDGAWAVLRTPVAAADLYRTVTRALEWDRLQREQHVVASRFTAQLRSLSDRERELLDLTITGKSLAEASAKLEADIATVLEQRQELWAKMGVCDDAGLVAVVDTVNQAIVRSLRFTL